MKRAAGLAALVVAGLAVRRYVGERPALAAVAAELRTPALAFVPSLGSMRLLPLHRRVGRLRTPAGRGVTVAERTIGTPALRIIVTTPDNQQIGRPAVLEIHSGGFVVGSPQFELSSFIAPLARELGAVVVSPDYRLAPEHRFPAAIDDCMTTLRWMRDHADELGIDANRIAVAGPSAGAGLSAIVAQRSLDEGIALRAQALVYPMLDDRTALREDFDGGDGYGVFLFSAAANRFGWISYLGREPRPSDAPEYSAAARRANLQGLAPAWIGVGDLDVLYDESIVYAERLTEAGVPCELVTVPGMYHGADGIKPKAPVIKDFRASMVAHLRKYLA